MATSTRERLVLAAHDLFYAEGFHAVGLDRILAEVGVTKTTFYNHFASKDDLVLEVLVQARAAVGERPETPPPIGRALRYAVGWLGLVVMLTVLIGILPAVLVYIALSLKLDGEKPLPVALATAVAVTALAWLLFEWGLSYDLYRGVFA